MSDFLKQLGAESDKRENLAELNQGIEDFIEKYQNAVADYLLEEIKKAAFLQAQLGRFSHEDGQRVINGVYEMPYGYIEDYCPGMKSARIEWTRKFSSRNLPVPEMISFQTTPIFRDLGVVTHSEKKKILWFEKTVLKKAKKVSFSLSNGLQAIMQLLKQKAQAVGITLSDLSYTYMFNTINKETGKEDGLWIKGCNVTFPDLCGSVVYEWANGNATYTVSYGSWMTGKAKIVYEVKY